MSLESSYLIYHLLHGRLTVSEFYSLFEDDHDCLRFFEDIDAVIIAYLLQNGTGNIPAFYEAIGEEGQKRLQEVNSAILDDHPLKMANALIWALKIQHNWQTEEGLDLLRNGLIQLQDSDSTPSHVLTRLSSDLERVATMTTNNQMADSFQASEGARHFIYSMMGLEQSPVLESGFAMLDSEYAPFVKGQATIFAGDEGCGKTAFMQQVAQKWLDRGSVGLWFCEMSKDEMRARDIVRNTQIGSLRRLREMGKENKPEVLMSSDAKYRIDQELARLSDHQILYCPSGNIDAHRILTECKYAFSLFGRLDFVIIDHVGKLNPIGKVSEAMRVIQTYEEIDSLVMPHFPETAFIVLQHLNSNIQRTYKGAGGVKMILPTKDDIRYKGSGAVDTVMVLIKDDLYQTALLGVNARDKLEEWLENDPDQYYAFKRQCYLWIVKHRWAEANNPVPLEFLGHFLTFREQQK